MACACGRTNLPSGSPTIVLGFDGMDYEVTKALMAQGRLPNLSRLAATGGFGPLATSFPPQSPVAWSTFSTGLAPEGHGIFDFVHRDPQTLEPYLSTTRTLPASWVLPLGTWQWPLRGGRVELLRGGQPFWATLKAQGLPTTIVKMPANYPPSGQATNELTGMGTPDLLGTYGTFTFFSSDPFAPAEGDVSGGRIRRVRVADHVVTTTLEGPDHPLRRRPGRLRVSIIAYRDPEQALARVIIGGQERLLQAGEWSDWIPVEFPLLPFQSVSGIARLYLKQVHPHFELYVSPINLNPKSPALPIAAPPRFAATLAQETGHFYTQGMPEDTKAVLAGVLTRDEFLDQARFTAAENLRQYEHLLARLDGGLLFHYFGHVDQVSHMLWRARDPTHPAYVGDQDVAYAHIIDQLYEGLDAIVGMTLERMAAETLLVVMSDHGFSSWRRSFDLNRWLEERGYLVMRTAAHRGSMTLADVDWSRTRAYGLGLNGLYLNLAGREREGIVSVGQRDSLLRELTGALIGIVDPASGRPSVTAVHRSATDHPADTYAERAPDLIVGYAKGTRSSSQSAQGGVGTRVLSDNFTDWSGDHCMDPVSVPGIVFANRPFDRPGYSLQDLSGMILRRVSQ